MCTGSLSRKKKLHKRFRGIRARERYFRKWNLQSFAGGYRELTKDDNNFKLIASAKQVDVA